MDNQEVDSEILTSIGTSLRKKNDVWELDLTELRVFMGLSVLSRIIADRIIEEVEGTAGDVSFLYKVNPNINPELIEMKIHHVQLYSKAGVLKETLNYKDEFHDQIRTVFGTFQRAKWAKFLQPEYYGEESLGNYSLIFPFHHESKNEKIDYRFILERVNDPCNVKRYFIRLTIENHEIANTDLNTISSVLVSDLGKRIYISGSTKIAISIRDGILTACHKGINYYSEENRTYNKLFEQLEKTKLGVLKQINFVWDEKFREFLERENPDNSFIIFKKVLLSLEANSVCGVLKNNHVIKIVVGNHNLYLYLSRLERVLNININLPPRKLELNYFLERMPILKSLANKQGHHLDSCNSNIFLIHHITSETLGFIESLRRLRINKLWILFVKYGGIVPSVYLDVLLELPSENFFAIGLSRHSEPNNEYYTLANYYSDISELDSLREELEQKKLGYFEAMKLSATHLFLKFAIQSFMKQEKILLIEDGGYLAPVVNQLSLEAKNTKDVFNTYLLETEIQESFPNFINQVLIGSVEHTRNGYNRLLETKEKYNKLFFSTYSIAVSKLKTIEESKEVAHSILSAIESILHSQGFVLSKRNIVILGSNGNIGKNIVKFLSNRLEGKETIQVDIRNEIDEPRTFRNIVDIPKDLSYDLDFFIGVIGKSILKPDFIEDIVLNGKKRKLFFASGSTKTVEFSDLSHWLHSIYNMEKPYIQNIPIKIQYDKIEDPQSGIRQGGVYKIQFLQNDKNIIKELYLLGDLSPINFLYYGVPTETMDGVMSQLLKVSIGLVNKYHKKQLQLPNLYAVDKEIDEWGNLI